MRVLSYLPIGALAVLAASSTLGFAACGGDADPAPGVTPEEDAATPPPAPTEDAAVTPAAVEVTIAPEIVRLRRGQSIATTVTVDRKGREGEVTLDARDLPPGVTADAITIPAGESEAQVPFRATDAADYGGPRAFKLRATIAGETVETSARLVVAGTPGTLDTSFSFDGAATVQLTDREHEATNSAIVTDDGSVVVAGVGQGPEPWLGFLLRLTGDGELDPTFGAGGKVLGAPSSDESSYGSLALLPDGRFLAFVTRVVGDTGMYDVRRFGLDGVADATFGAGGRVVVPDDGEIVRRPNGGFLVRGQTAVAAFDDSGVVDGAFGESGTLSAPGRQLAIDASNRLILCGSDAEGFVLRRYTAKGVLDTTFGTDGVARVPVTLPDRDPSCRKVVVQADGKITFAGFTIRTTYADSRGMLGRVLDDGSVDPAFGTAGLRVYGSSTTQSKLLGLVLQSDQKLVALVIVEGVGSVLARYNPDGSSDASFGAAGVVSPLPTGSGTIQLAHDRAAGRVHVVGTPPGGGVGVHILRYWL